MKTQKTKTKRDGPLTKDEYQSERWMLRTPGRRALHFVFGFGISGYGIYGDLTRNLYTPVGIALSSWLRHLMLLCYLLYSATFLLPLVYFYFGHGMKHPDILFKMSSVCLVLSTIIGCIAVVLAV